MDEITPKQIISYEIGASWWGWLIWWNWGQVLAAWYFAAKVNVKYRRYKQNRTAFKNILKG